MYINEANKITLEAEPPGGDNNPLVLSRFQSLLRSCLKAKEDVIKQYVAKLVKLMRITDIEMALISLVIEPLEWSNFSGRLY